MDTTAEEIRQEQRYFDAAWEHRERKRAEIRLAPSAAANSGAAVRLRQDADARLEQIGGPEEPVAIGRMDFDDGERFYLGYHAISDEHRNLVVINWKMPAAAPYHKASHADPRGLRMKRSFDCSGNTITSFNDVVFKELAAAVAELVAQDVVDDALLADLDRNRTGAMQDIVRTIQAAQFELIRAPIDQLTIIQGGPGTGKTAVALHRVSWLLYNHMDRLSAQDVLIVGPTPTFTRYTNTVLPTLGDTNVVQRDIHQLHPPVKRGRSEEPAVVKLKGDGRMAGLVRRGLYARVGPADGPSFEAHVDGRQMLLPADELRTLVTRCRTSTGSYAEQRQLFRGLLGDMITSHSPLDPQRVRAALDPVLDRLWPSFTAASFLRELFGSRDRLLAAAGDDFTAREVSQLHRRPSERVSEEVWSNADLGLLDEAEHLINGVDVRYSHIIVDEAQDLSPMQLRAIARRSVNGSMTVVGDLAQSTGHWARDDWDEVLHHLPAELPQVREELQYGYRVPRQVFELAAKLLPIAAPNVHAPQVVRDGPAEPNVHQIEVDERADRTVRAAMSQAAHGRSVAIICPASCRTNIEAALTAADVAWRAASAGELGPGINVVSPQESKGLEFDAVVVVEPEDIVAEDERGHRLLYVAMTRTTRYLDIVCVGSPLPLGANTGPDDASPRLPRQPVSEDRTPAAVAEADDSRTGSPAPVRQAPVSQRFVDLAAEEVVTLLRGTVAPNLWAPVLARAGELLAGENADDYR